MVASARIVAAAESIPSYSPPSGANAHCHIIHDHASLLPSKSLLDRFSRFCSAHISAHWHVETTLWRHDVCSISPHSVLWHGVYKSSLTTHTHTRLTALCPGLPRWAGTRKVKPIWILLKQETVSGSGISWAICKSVPRSRQITMPAHHHSVFTDRMPFLPPNQQRQSTEGTSTEGTKNPA